MGNGFVFHAVVDDVCSEHEIEGTSPGGIAPVDENEVRFEDPDRASVSPRENDGVRVNVRERHSAAPQAGGDSGQTESAAEVEDVQTLDRRTGSKTASDCARRRPDLRPVGNGN